MEVSFGNIIEPVLDLLASCDWLPEGELRALAASARFGTSIVSLSQSKHPESSGVNIAMENNHLK